MMHQIKEVPEVESSHRSTIGVGKVRKMAKTQTRVYNTVRGGDLGSESL